VTIDVVYDGCRPPNGLSSTTVAHSLLLAGGTALAVVYHLGTFGLAWAHLDAVAGRHFVFAGIDATLSLLLLRRPRWLIVPVSILAVQAFWSHGRGIWIAWQNARQVDWISAAVLVYLPFLLYAAIWRARTASRNGRDQ